MTARKAFVAIVVTVAGLWTALAWAGDPYFVSSRYDRRQMLDQDLTLTAGGQLKVRVDDVDLHLKSGDKAHIDVFVSGPDLKEAVEYYEDYVQFKIDNRSGGVAIETREAREKRFWPWNKYRNVRVWAVVTVPTRVDADVRTEDGDIQIDELDGATVIETLDGDVRVGTLTGPSVRLETADGDIRVNKIDVADVELRTTDGDMNIKSLTAKTVTVRSADGDIDLPSLEADEITLDCADGDIGVGARGKRLSASVGDGDLDVVLLVAMETSLRASDGDISLVVPASAGANLDLRGEDVNVRGKVSIRGSVSDDRVVGTINDGGPLVHARTHDGRIRLSVR
jgi:hypothetical protein